MRFKQVPEFPRIKRRATPSTIINKFLESDFKVVEVINENDYSSFHNMQHALRQCVYANFRGRVRVVQRDGKIYLTRP